MLSHLRIRSLLSSFLCCLLFAPLVGCGGDKAPTQINPDAIDQFLEENPDEAYSSDGLAEEMAEDDGAG